MASDAVKTLEQGIRNLINPEMVSRGFNYEASTRTFRKRTDGCVQIVNFQVGVRTMTGKFTVNLAVFHPEYKEPALREFAPDDPSEFHCYMKFRRRLSVLRDTQFTKFFRSFVRSTDGFLKWWLVTPTDKWWTFSSDKVQVETSLGLVRELLLVRGLDWLNRNSDAELLKAAFEEASARLSRAK